MFKDRAEAGSKLAKYFDYLKGKNAVVYALPRGGVVVGAEIAKAIGAPLDLIITRKIGHPNQPEYAIGAVAENGYTVFNEEEVSKIEQNWLREETEKQRMEAKRRRELYLGKREPISCKGKIAILVDDGIATGLTMKAAVRELQMQHQPKEIYVAVPVASAGMSEELQKLGVKLMAAEIPEDFLGAIGAYYQDFSPVSDEDVIRLIQTQSF